MGGIEFDFPVVDFSEIKDAALHHKSFHSLMDYLFNAKYKEKIRLRSYGLATSDSSVFLELKRKVNGLVYKRRINTTLGIASSFFENNDSLGSDSQIAKEITFFRDYYKNLKPSCLIIYDRTAYYEPGGSLRLTIDDNPRFRFDNLNLTTSLDGTSILPDGNTILEIKVQGAMPLWLSHILDKGNIRKGSISKYGEAYKKMTQLVLEGIY